MLRFKQGESYLWLLGVYFVIFLGLMFGLGNANGTARWGVLLLPAFSLLLLTTTLRSGVALDKSWRATYLKDNWHYRVSIAAHFVLLVWFSVFSYVVITWGSHAK